MSKKARRYETWQDVVDHIQALSDARYGFKAELAKAVGLNSGQLGNYTKPIQSTGRPSEPRWTLGRAIVEYLEEHHPE